LQEWKELFIVLARKNGCNLACNSTLFLLFFFAHLQEKLKKEVIHIQTTKVSFV